MKTYDLPDGLEDPLLLQTQLQTKPEEYWLARGEKMALKLFHEMAERVPAYKDFLKKNKFDSTTVKNIDDFKKVPLIDKDNYLRKYLRAEMSWDGEFGKGEWTISTTSGSTGEPYYFPRRAEQDQQYALTAELYLRSNFDIQNRKTLYIVAFPMGAWIGGVFTYEALKMVTERGDYDLSVITPGINKLAIINSIKELAGEYDQVIIGAYAPFLKDIIDDGKRAGINWKKVNAKYVFSAEAFSEDLRDYVVKESALKNVYLDTLNHYGTVDLGTMAHETPLSVLARRTMFIDNPEIKTLLPENHKQPTLAQYLPEMFYFEEEKSNLICSAYSGIPLVRYDLKDYGGVITKESLYNHFEAEGSNLESLVRRNGLDDTVWNLPFVYVYERNDMSVSYYAFVVYPDTIRRALMEKKLTKNITGKFTMHVQYSKNGRQQLIVDVECKYGIDQSAKLEKTIQKLVHSRLIHENSEYRETYSLKGDIVTPNIQLWEYESTDHFKPGTKQKWVKK